MPVRMLNFLQTPPPIKRQMGMISRTEEWQDVIIALGAGLKPHEYISVTYPPEHEIHKHLKQANNSLLNLLKDKIRKMQLPYDAYMREEVIYIVGRGVIS